MIVQPALPAAAVSEEPRIVRPAAFEASFGTLEVVMPAGSLVARVLVNGKTVASVSTGGATHMTVNLSLPLRDSTLRVVALASSGASRSSRPVGPVFGMPRAARPRLARSWLDGALGGQVTHLVRSFRGVASAYVLNVRTGAGAAWNARARFPAASALKLAIAVEALRALRGPPPHGSSVDTLLHAAIVDSDNKAANRLEVLVGGSITGGSARVNALMRALGLINTDMYGGYEIEDREARPIPVSVNEQPAISRTKYSTAYDLAQLMRDVYLAAAGNGPLLRRVDGFTSREARYLLYLLFHVTDRGKLDRFLPRSTAVAHKAGWNSVARDDNGLVVWQGGAFVAAVMTWSPAGVGTSSDVLAGNVARRAFDRFRLSPDSR